MRRSLSNDYSDKERVLSFILEKLSDKSIEDLKFKDYEKIKDFKLEYDLGIDSLDKVELFMQLEDEFKISILDEYLESIDSIKDLLELCYDKIIKK